MKLIRDIESDEDRFSGQSHQYTADKLMQLVSKNSDPHTIALLGDRGSGKSTIINILKKNLESQKFLFVGIDLWSEWHKDLTKLVIDRLSSEAKYYLEKKVSCKNIKNKVEKNIEEVRQKYAKGEKLKTVNKHSILNFPERIFFLILAASPFCGYFLIRNLFDKGNYEIVTIASAVILFITTITILINPKVSKGSSKKVLSLLFGAASEHIEHEKDDLELMLSKRIEADIDNIKSIIGAEKVIITLDNLDRLSGDQLVEAIDFLHIMDSRLRNIKDVHVISSVTPHMVLGETKNWEENEGGSYLPAKIPVGDEDLLYRIFSAQIQVPQILIEDWENWARLVIDQLFSQNDENISEEVLQRSMFILDYFYNYKNLPSPRRIINTVNQAYLNIYPGFGSDFFSTALFYVLFSNQVGQGIYKNGNPTSYISDMIKDVLHNESHIALFSWHFSVPRSKAVDITKNSIDIRKCIESGDIGILKDIESPEIERAAAIALRSLSEDGGSFRIGGNFLSFYLSSHPNPISRIRINLKDINRFISVLDSDPVSIELDKNSIVRGLKKSDDFEIEVENFFSAIFNKFKDISSFGEFHLATYKMFFEAAESVSVDMGRPRVRLDRDKFPVVAREFAEKNIMRGDLFQLENASNCIEWYICNDISQHVSDPQSIKAIVYFVLYTGVGGFERPFDLSDKGGYDIEEKLIFFSLFLFFNVKKGSGSIDEYSFIGPWMQRITKLLESSNNIKDHIIGVSFLVSKNIPNDQFDEIVRVIRKNWDVILQRASPKHFFVNKDIVEFYLKACPEKQVLDGIKKLGLGEVVENSIHQLYHEKS